MTIKFVTETGSTYEVDYESMRIRRLNGTNTPTNRQGHDGEWKAFVKLDRVEVGTSAFIFWDPETTPLLPGSLGGSPCTVTSQIVAVFDT